MEILDQGKFPLKEPMAQELLRVMAGLYLSEREAVRFVAPFGINQINIQPGLSPIDRWQDLLEMLAREGRLRAAVKATRDAFPENPRVPFLDALLADRPAPVSAEPLQKGGAPGFDDTVTSPEALLFFDDLTMPVGKVSNLIATLSKMITIAPAICWGRRHRPQPAARDVSRRSRTRHKSFSTFNWPICRYRRSTCASLVAPSAAAPPSKTHRTIQ
jgi:hypothetical protein